MGKQIVLRYEVAWEKEKRILCSLLLKIDTNGGLGWMDHEII